MAYFLSNQISERLQGDNKKPVGSVEIDFSHPLSKKLLAYWLLNNLNESTGSGHHLTTATMPDKVPLGYAFDTDADVLSSNGWFHLNDYSKCTAVVRCKPSSTAVAAQAFSARTGISDNTRFYIYHDAVGDLRFYVGNTYAGGGTISADNTYTIAVERDGSNANGWLDGVNVAGPTAITVGTTGTTNALALGAYAITPSNDDFNGEIHYCALFKDTLTASEHKLLHDDPYCLLKSAKQIPTLIAVGGAPATVIPTNPINGPLKGPLGGPICI